MTFITRIKAHHTELTETERVYIEDKLAPLEKELHGETAYTCDVEIERSTHHQTGDVVRAEIVFTIRGDVFRAESTRDTLLNALDEVRAEMQRILRTRRGRMRTLIRDGARTFRKMLGK